MATPHKVTITFEVEAETPGHAMVKIEHYLRGKGVWPEHYKTIEANRMGLWTGTE